MSGPLSGYKVLDMSRVLAGPAATVLLADQGADVIKVEPLRGDVVRAMGGGGVTTGYLTSNRGKRSIALDLKSEAGISIVKRLAKDADVFVQNFRPGAIDGMGLGEPVVRSLNPNIIYVSMSGFGEKGPYAHKRVYDPVIQAESGLMSMTGDKEGAPMRTGISLIDIITGLFAGQAVLAALHEREQSGKGQYLEVPLFDSGVNMLSHTASAYLIDGLVMGRVGNASEAAMPVGAYQAADGNFTMALTSDRQFATFCEKVLERPTLADDPEFVTNTARVANSKRLENLLQKTFATAPRDHWLALFATAGIPAGPIRDVGEALRSSEVANRNLITDAPHSSAGRVPQIRSPMHFDRTPVVEPVGAPLLGEHTEWVLRDVLGRSDINIKKLRKSGTIL